ncbi:MAG: UMP kinase [Dehalococcoidia bacterium]|jgi:uridylate kinase
MSKRGKRTLLKISGEALAGDDRFGINASTLSKIAAQIRTAHEASPEIGIVIGAGNMLRGSAVSGDGQTMDRVSADYAGMLATIINSLALQDALEKTGLDVRIQSALNVVEVAEPFVCRRAVAHLEAGRVVIFAGGTGSPYFTTDTAAALRAVEIGADVLLMAKNKVDGVYEANPRKEPGARRFQTLNYNEALDRRLGVVDAAALALCRDCGLPIVVFDLMAPDGIVRAVRGERIGTLVADTETVLAGPKPSS